MIMAEQDTLRTETFPSGIASVGLGTVERRNLGGRTAAAAA